MGWNDLIGRQLGSYTIMDELGRGGSSRVYRGRDGETQRDVAVKVIPNDAEDRVGFVRRFEREVQAVAQLNHPNIVAVYDRGETDDLVYLVMQCVTGGTLRLRLGRPLPVGGAAALVIQMALALHHAHLHGIIHRDVKPSNMLIDSANPQYVLLTDFGIAKLQGLRGLTKTGTTIGTPEYMSPEQAEGKEIDPRADVYSLGCVLYEALSGRPPFTGSTSVSVLYQQVHSRPAYIRGFNPDIPRGLVRILEQALAKRPEDRFGTADGLAQALYPFADDSLPSFLPRSATGTLHLPPTAASLPEKDTQPPEPDSLPLPPPEVPDLVSGVSSSQPWDGAISAMPDADVLVLRSPDSGRLIPPLSSDGLGGPVPPIAERGLGAEGLDALFPDDADVQSTRNTYQATQRSVASGKLGSRAAPSGTPGAPHVPAAPNAPGSPNMPSIPGAPGMGGTPPTPRHPSLPGMPGSPAIPGSPGMPGVQGIAGRTSGPLSDAGQPGQPSRPRGAPNSQTIPLPAFRLPPKKTQPLNLPLTDDGRLDMDALMAQVEAPRAPSPQAPPPPVTRYESPSGPPRRQQYEQTSPSTYGTGDAGATAYPRYTPGGAPGAGVSGPMSRMPEAEGWERYGVGGEPQWQDDAPGREARRGDTPVVAFRRALVETSMLHSADPVWRPEPEEQSNVSLRQARRRIPLPLPLGRRPMIASITVAALLLVSLATWIGLSTSGLLTLAHGRGQPTPIVKATATSTPLPTASPTQGATATATNDPRVALDRQAAASFRAVTLTTYNDSGCGANTTHFSSGQAIFVNLCSSSSAVSGPMNVVIRQGGQALYSMVNGQRVSPGSHYWYSRYGVPPGTYDMLVTLQINGYSATARDIQFTVG